MKGGLPNPKYKVLPHQSGEAALFVPF